MPSRSPARVSAVESVTLSCNSPAATALVCDAFVQQQLQICAASINLNLNLGNTRLGYVRLPVFKSFGPWGVPTALRKSGFDAWGLYVSRL